MDLLGKIFTRLMAGILEAILLFVLVNSLYGIYKISPLVMLGDPGFEIMFIISLTIAALGFLGGVVTGETMLDE